MIHTLLPKQEEMFNCPHNELTDVCCYQGGYGSGKTTGGVLLGYTLAKTYPGSIGLVGAETFTLLKDTTIKKYEELIPLSDIKSWTQVPNILTLKNGSQIWFRPLKDFERIKSIEVHWCHIEEASQCAHTILPHILARLRKAPKDEWPDFRHRLFLTTNPEEMPGFLDDTFIHPEKPDCRFRFIHAPTDENTFLTNIKSDYVDMLATTMSDDEKHVYIGGNTGTGIGGRFYYSFDRKLHVNKRAEYQPNLPLNLSFDFNAYFMTLILIQEVRGETHVVDEICLKGGSDTTSLCKAFQNKYKDHKSGIRVYGDPSGYANDHRIRRHDYDLIRDVLGRMPGFVIKVRPGDHAKQENRLRNRYIAVNSLYRTGKLVINPKCVYVIKSMERTKIADGDKITKEKVSNPKDKRFDVDHPGDALDYYLVAEHPYKKVTLKFH